MSSKRKTIINNTIDKWIDSKLLGKYRRTLTVGDPVFNGYHEQCNWEMNSSKALKEISIDINSWWTYM